ncbi:MULTISPECIES: ABC transporter permease [Pseudomonadaceae]|uniref:ABC transporter permease n=1 Tax=Pseudomonadaceae TaxID=135621 RepID=UPI0015E3C8E7|nr:MULTISPECIES: ABC transporter permease [Pseudomonadaceae]MBA1263050.1 ABC transporter permease [Stutzerimonas stutzeri]
MVEQQAGRHGPFLLQTLIESLDNLRLLGRRSLLALLGIAVGCAAVIALLNIGHNAANESIRTFKGLGADTLVATFPHSPGDDRPGPTQLDIQALRAALPMIEQTAPLILHSAHIQHRGQTTNAIVAGTGSGLVNVLELRLERGRFLSDFDHHSTYAIVGARVTRDLGHPGSPLQLGDRLPINGYLFEVIGILASKAPNPLASVAADDSVFIPIEGMRRLQPAPEISSIVARTQNASQVNAAAGALKAYLGTLPKSREADVLIPQQLLDGLTRQANTFAYLLAGLGGISLLVGGVGVMNVMLMNVAERRREIGIRMALGAKASDIRNLFLLEAATLSIAGALVGAIVGLAAAYAFVRISGWSFSLAPLSLPLGVCSSLMVGLFFGLHPALAAARLQPVQALRDD